MNAVRFSIDREARIAVLPPRPATRSSGRDTPTWRTRPVRRPSRWPVVVCALIATYAGVTAFVRSPLGAKPEVRQTLAVARAESLSALDKLAWAAVDALDALDL